MVKRCSSRGCEEAYWPLPPGPASRPKETRPTVLVPVFLPPAPPATRQAAPSPSSSAQHYGEETEAPVSPTYFGEEPPDTLVAFGTEDRRAWEGTPGVGGTGRNPRRAETIVPWNVRLPRQLEAEAGLVA